MFWLPLAALSLATILFRLTPLDMALQGLFHVPGTEWILGESRTFRLLYDYGTFPALLISCSALIGGITCLFRGNLRNLLGTFLFLTLAMIVGPGLIINSCFKENFGRPRPREVIEFGGTASYRPVLEPDIGADAHSFPSGHASMGFFWMLPYFMYLAYDRRLAHLFLTGGFLYGILMGMARMAQGGHFASDVIWSAAIVYYVGWVLFYCLDRASLPLRPIIVKRPAEAPVHGTETQPVTS